MDKENLNPETTESENESLENETLEDESLENESQEATESEDESKDTVPLKSHLRVKDENRELKRQVAKLSAAQYEERVRAKKQNVFQEWKNKGFDDATAELMSEQIADIYKELASVDNKRNQNYLEEEIKDLKTDDFYSDIAEYKNQIIDTINKAAKAGIDMNVKQAYAAVVDIDSKLKEATTKNEVKKRLKNKGQSSSNLDTSSSSSTKDIYNLDEHDKKALEQLKQMQPNRGWTAKKYYEMIKKIE